jgi:hypothetical protein
MDKCCIIFAAYDVRNDDEAADQNSMQHFNGETETFSSLPALQVSSEALLSPFSFLLPSAVASHLVGKANIPRALPIILLRAS